MHCTAHLQSRLWPKTRGISWCHVRDTHNVTCKDECIWTTVLLSSLWEINWTEQLNIHNSWKSLYSLAFLFSYFSAISPLSSGNHEHMVIRCSSKCYERWSEDDEGMGTLSVNAELCHIRVIKWSWWFSFGQ